jgi:hypothetical protein
VWPGGAASPESRAFQDTGFLVLRTSTSQAILDAGPHGFLNGGHAHADALSLVLSIEGQPLLIDPGTGTYTMDAAMRDRFRSTAMHNTIVVDGRCQSVPDGPFHWRSRTNARIEAFRPGVGLIEGSHDGYAPLIHRRTILNDGRDLWLIVDHLIGDGPHRMDAYWHLDPQWCQAGRRPSDAGDIGHPAGMRAAIVSTAHESHTYHGDAEGLGWCAPVYGRVIPSLTLRFTEYGIATFSIVTAIAASATTARAFPLSITQLPIAADAPDGWHRTAVLVLFNGAATIASFAAPSGATRDRRVRHRVRARGGELVTDASVALLRLSRAGEAEELRLLDGRVAHWTGRTPFAIDLPERVDELRFDPRALESVEGSTEEGTHVRHRRIR